MNNLQNRPDNYLVISILSTIFCCWPLGIPAIIQASKVNTKFAEGDYESAKRASKAARNWSIWSAIAALLFWVLYIGFFGLALFAGLSSR